MTPARGLEKTEASRRAQPVQPVSLGARLGKLMPALSAKDRFLIELRAWNADQTPDPQIRKTMPTTR